MTRNDTTADQRPDIYLTSTECDALFELALGARQRHPSSSALLLAELERAEIRGREDLPEQTVVMNSHIEFVDEGSGARRSVQLVYPSEADIVAGRISILTPVGAGLIGMSAGHAISWPDREGRDRLLRIESVIAPSGDDL